MTTIEAWGEVFNLSYGNTWKPIPKALKVMLGLDDRLGICGGVLCTQHAAKGMNEFINRLNAIQERIK